MEHSKHLWRAVILVVFGIGAFLAVRMLLIPETWGYYGHFRAADLHDQQAKPAVHGDGNQDCAGCHAAEYDEASQGRHKSLLCEGCHAPLTSHVQGDKKSADMAMNRTQELCLRCHQHLVARPSGFPQVDLEAHLKEMDMEPSEDVCFNCHSPHSPEM